MGGAFGCRFAGGLASAGSSLAQQLNGDTGRTIGPHTNFTRSSYTISSPDLQGSPPAVARQVWRQRTSLVVHPVLPSPVAVVLPPPSPVSVAHPSIVVPDPPAPSGRRQPVARPTSVVVVPVRSRWRTRPPTMTSRRRRLLVVSRAMMSPTAPTCRPLAPTTLPSPMSARCPAAAALDVVVVVDRCPAALACDSPFGLELDLDLLLDLLFGVPFTARQSSERRKKGELAFPTRLASDDRGEEQRGKERTPCVGPYPPSPALLRAAAPRAPRPSVERSVQTLCEERNSNTKPHRCVPGQLLARKQ